MRFSRFLQALIASVLIVGSVLCRLFALPPDPYSQEGWQTLPNLNTKAANNTITEAFVKDLWVDAGEGNDQNDGLSPLTALQTIQRASNLAGPGTTIHIQPGVYRESVIPARSGTTFGSILYLAEAGPGTAIIRGSEPSASLPWLQLTSNTIGLPPGVDPTKIFYTDLSAWGLSSAPRFVVELDDQGGVAARLPMAREPDWQVVTEWRYHEFWWAADGGNDVADCDPPIDPDPFYCDLESRSLTQLTDRQNDVEPTGIEAGNLTTLGNLTGAKLVVMDTNTGTFIFRRKIIAHNVSAGLITVDENCEHGYDSDNPALGWGSKYYVEGLPYLLDSPGEWWYDPGNGHLYIWPRNPGTPAAMDIEISHHEDGFILKNRSFITLEGLTIEFFNRNAVIAANTDFFDKSHLDTIRNTTIRYAERGVWLSQYVNPDSPLDCTIDGFTIENSEISFMDEDAFYIYSSWGSSSSAASFTRPGVINTLIRGNEIHHLGLNADSEGVGGVISYPDHLRFEKNHIHHVSHTGVLIRRSIVQSPKTYDFESNEIKIGDILIRDNIFEKACLNHADCGALKITGTPPDRQVFRDLLVTGNIFRNTFGWTYILEKRGQIGGPSSTVDGMMGMGFYIDNASGIYAYRNIAYNNGFAGFKLSGAWRDGDIIFYNNIIANSLNGFHSGGFGYDTHDGSVNTQIFNNIILNHESFGIFLSDADGVFENTEVDHNLYYENGWRSYEQGGEWEAGNIRLDIPGLDRYYQTLQEIQAGTSWEDHGVEGTPAFWEYEISDHDLFDGSWPELHLTTASSNAIDRGAAALPASITASLTKFVVFDPHWGTAYDMGRYEAGFVILSNPSAAAIEPGDEARYTLSLFPPDLPYSVTLQATTSSPSLIISLEPTVISSETKAVLVITDIHTDPELFPGILSTVKISCNGGDFSRDTFVHLLVGGSRDYFPSVMKSKP